LETNSAIRILIVDDHPVVRAGLASMLGTQPGISVVGSASSGEEALDLVARAEPEIILLDLRMPGMNGIETIRALKGRGSNARIIILTSFETDEDVYRAVEAGAHGYLLKNTSEACMLEAIRAVHSNQRYFPPAIAAKLAERIARVTLTARENQTLELLAKGLTNKQIGLALHISEHTARNHVNSILEKLGVSDRTEAVITALQQGLVTLV
jgi:DNA-binding NarL/FixJ family response regulator